MKTHFGSMAALLSLTLCGTALYAQSADPDARSATGPSTTAAGLHDADVSTSEPVQPVQTMAQAGSQVRIVRLSEGRGEVKMDRNNGTSRDSNFGRGYEAAVPNLPIVQGAKLKTLEGVAEVEFEDNSTLRLTPNTEVEFPRLGRNPSGSTASEIRVLKGIVYVSLVETKGNEFKVSFGSNKLTLPPSSHIQLYVGNPTSRLGVYDGNIQVDYASGSTTVGKKKALLFDGASQSAPTLVASLEKSPFDTWDKDAVDYHKRVAQTYVQTAANGGSGPVYGLSDLSYYGSFVNMDGCGQVWRPYFASAAWDPFSNGTWAWYQNSAYSGGYSWVSPYPWGWAPYHSGQWQQCNNGAWGWRPGGSFVGLGNAGLTNSVKYLNTVKTPPARPRMPGEPRSGQPTMISVNARPLPVSTLKGETFTFHNDSAGLGVPRLAFGNLAKVSEGVAQHGFANTAVYPSSAISSPAAPGRIGSSPSSGISSRPSSTSFSSAGSSLSHGSSMGSSGGSSMGSAGTSSGRAASHR